MSALEVMGIVVGSFLGGVLLAVLGVAMPLSNRLTRLETKVDQLRDDAKRPPVVCPAHGELETAVAVLQSDIAAIKGRLEGKVI